MAFSLIISNGKISNYVKWQYPNLHHMELSQFILNGNISSFIKWQRLNLLKMTFFHFIFISFSVFCVDHLSVLVAHHLILQRENVKLFEPRYGILLIPSWSI